MNTIELNAILYYADYLSLRTISKPVTDNCKYYFVHNTPINSAYIVNLEPFYDKDNLFYKQAEDEYNELKDKFGEAGVMSFLENISDLKACGTVGAKQMLKCIHRYSTTIDRKKAFSRYYRWLDKQKYIQFVESENGEQVEQECSRYVAHSERMRGKQIIYQSPEMA